MHVEHLFVSPGHNFFGHHDRSASEYPIVAAKRIECVAGRGFFDYKETYKGQITFFDLEVLEALRDELNLPHAQPDATRRNAFVRGADLSSLIGKQFEVLEFPEAFCCRREIGRLEGLERMKRIADLFLLQPVIGTMQRLCSGIMHQNNLTKTWQETLT